MSLSCTGTLFMGTSKTGLFQQLFGLLSRAKHHHFYALLFHLENSTDLAVAELFHMCQPEHGTFLRCELVKDSRHIYGQIEFLMHTLRDLRPLSPITFAFLFTPAIAKNIGCRSVEIGLALPFIHGRCVNHSDVGLLQDFVC